MLGPHASAPGLYGHLSSGRARNWRHGGRQTCGSHGDSPLAQPLAQPPAARPSPCCARCADDKVEYAYINLLRNSERYTGYKGEHAARVWGAIYSQARREGWRWCW